MSDEPTSAGEYLGALPVGWTHASLAELTDKLVDGSHNPPPKASTGKPMLSARNIADGRVNFDDYRLIDSEHFDLENRRTNVTSGDVLLTIVGTIGRSAVVPTNVENFTLQRSVAVMTPSSAIRSEFLSHYFQSPAVQRWFEDNAKGTAQKGVYLGMLSRLTLPVPPIDEQRRIVERTNGLLLRTTRAQAELNRIPILVARYKQRLLALAFSGLLPALNPNSTKAKFHNIGDVVDISSGYVFPKDRQGKTKGDFPFAKVSDISRAVAENGGTLATASNYVDQEDLKTLKVKPVPAESTVFAKIGEALKLNRRAITTVPLILDNNCMALSPDKSKLLPSYLFRFMETVDLGPLSVATAVPSVRRGDIASLQILLPSLNEQAEIVRRIESAFNWLDRMAADHGAARRFLPKLDAAILSKAFGGTLVSQDPDDEPASVLLERIKMERAAAPKAKRGRQANETRSPMDLHIMAKNLEQVLAEAGDWISSQDAFQKCGMGGAATTEEIEKIYAELRNLDKVGKLETEPVNDDQGRKVHDRLRLKVA